MLKPLKLHAGSFEVTHVLTMAESLGRDVLQEDLDIPDNGTDVCDEKGSPTEEDVSDS